MWSKEHEPPNHLQGQGPNIALAHGWDDLACRHEQCHQVHIHPKPQSMSLFGYADSADILRADFKNEITLGSGPVLDPVSLLFLEWMEMWVQRQGSLQRWMEIQERKLQAEEPGKASLQSLWGEA